MILFDITKFDSQKVYLLQGRIGNIKDSVELNADCFCKGIRYNDNERISRLVLGYIIGSEKGVIDYESANANFLSLNTTQIDPLIYRAVYEAAESDFYYEFEKEW